MWRLRVDQVDSLDDYARVLAYLSGLAVVEKVDVDRVSSNASYFLLNTLGNDEDLHNAIALNSVLRLSDSARTGSDGTLLHYELLP